MPEKEKWEDDASGSSQASDRPAERKDKGRSKTRKATMSRAEVELSKLKKFIEKKKVKYNNFYDESCNYSVHGKQLKFAKKSLFILSDQNVIRYYIVWLHESKAFEIFIITTILVNTIILAMQDYRYRIGDNVSDQWRNDLISNTETAFSSIYICEFLLKIIGMGFAFEKGAYLRDFWNILDFTIVLSSIINIIPQIPITFMGVKALRVLRPLRSINSVKGLKILMNSLLEALPSLGNVIIFLLFTIVMFSVIGLQLFSGIFASRCRTTAAPINSYWQIDTTYEKLCADDIQGCPSSLFCGNSLTHNAIYDTSELDIQKLQYGFTTFDNMGWALFTVFQSLTTEGWSKFIYTMVDAYEPIYVYVYFISLILIGAFFLVNLILAVINSTFVQQQEDSDKSKDIPIGEKKTEGEALSEGEEQVPMKDQNNKDEMTFVQHERSSILPGMRKKRSNFPSIDFSSQAHIIPLESMTLPMTKVDSTVKTRTDLTESNLKTKIKESDNQLQEKRYAGNQSSMMIQQDNLTENDHIPEVYRISNWSQLRRIATSNFIQTKDGRNIFERIMSSTWFLIFTTFMIVGNTVVLSLDRYPLSTSESDILDLTNTIFTIGFVLEMIIKILGTGFRNYVKSKYNLFDSFIVIVSLLDVSLSYSGLNLANLGVLSALRAFRLFRIFKLARSWVTLSTLLSVISHTIASIQHFFTLLLIFIIITSLIGMELFAYQVRFDSNWHPTSDLLNGTSPRVNFDNFPNSLTTVFILLTNESWNLIMYDHIRAMGLPYSIFFIFVVIFGNYILLKLFIAILIYNFAEATVKYEKKQKLEKQKKQKVMLGKQAQFQGTQDDLEGIEMAAMTPLQQSPKNSVIGKMNPGPLPIFKQHTFSGSKDTASTQGQNGPKRTAMVVPFSPHESNKFGKGSISPPLSMTGGALAPGSILSRRKSIQFMKNSINLSTSMYGSNVDDGEEYFPPQGSSLFILPHNSCLRRLIFRITKHPYFEYSIILLILVTSVLLCIDTPLNDPNSEEAYVIQIMNYIITSCFIFEAAMKIMSYGFIFNGPNSYLRNASNCVDFLIVVMSSLDFLSLNGSSSIDLSTFKAIRILRILRPLKIISKSEGLKLAMNSLVNSFPSLVNLQIVIFICFLLFGIFGVNYFKGTYYRCLGIDSLLDSVMTKQDCFDLGGDWINQQFNFDNILNALVTLFILSTTEGWIDRMQHGVDSVGIDMQPKKDNNMYWQLYFIAFVFIGAFFVINLFVGIIVDSFSKEKDKLGGMHLLKDEQQDWVYLQERILNSEPIIKLVIKEDSAQFRKYLEKVVMHPWFDQFIFICILLNTINFMMVWVNQDDTILNIVTIINNVFMYTFLAEAIMKICVYGTLYFSDSSNVMDFTIVFLSTAGTIVDYFNILSSVTTVTSVFLLLRVIRILRLVKKIDSLRLILNTIIISLPALINIGGLLFLLLFLYSVLGMNLFAYVKPGLSGSGVTDKVHFKSFFTSFFTLLKISTGEEWDLLMEDLTMDQSSVNACLDISTYDDYIKYGINGCGNMWGMPFLMSFQILFAMIVLNLFVAVILEGFDKSERDEKSVIKPNQIEAFQLEWNVHDRLGIGFIPAGKLFDILDKLDHPFGWQNLSINHTQKKYSIASMELPLYSFREGKGYFINYYDTLEKISLIATKYMTDNFEVVQDKKIKVVRDIFKKKQSRLRQNKAYSANLFTLIDFIAAMILEAKFMELKEKTKVKEID